MAITSVKILEQPEHGHASVNLDNSLSFTADGAKYHGPVSFSYEVTFDDMSTEIRTKRGFITGDYWTQVEAAFEAGKTETTVAGPVRSVTVSTTGKTVNEICAEAGVSDTRDLRQQRWSFGDLYSSNREFFDTYSEEGTSSATAVDQELGVLIYYEYQTGRTQKDGWGTGENFYMLPVDASDRVIVEHGDNHRKVYVSATGLTAADIAALEGLTEADITKFWLEQNPEYGGSESMALAPGEAFELWWILLNGRKRSHWLLFERGHDGFIYSRAADDSTSRIYVRDSSGESPLHPVYIGSWGTGSAPLVDAGGPMYQDPSHNFVIQGVRMGNQKILGPHTNILYDDMYFSGGEVALQHERSATIRNSFLVDAWRNSNPDSDALKWDPFLSRESGMVAFFKGGLFMEGVFIDHAGWAPDFAYDMSSNFGHPPSYYSHNQYLGASTYDVTMRNCIVMRGASHGTMARAGIYLKDIAMIDNNIPLNILGGDYKKEGPHGNYSLVDGCLVTYGGSVGLAPDSSEQVDKLGGTNWGIGNGGLLSSFVGNIVAHCNEPSDPNDTNMGSTNALSHHKGTELVTYDDTIVWRWNVGVGSTSQNVEGLDIPTMDATTLLNYNASLALPTATDPVFVEKSRQPTGDFSQYIRTLPGPNIPIAAKDLLSYFRAGFGITEPVVRTVATTLNFVPDMRGDGVRWDNPRNWDTGDLPETVVGDSVDLGGKRVILATKTISLINLNFGRFGHLITTSGKLSVTGDLNVSVGCRLDIGLVGQVWLRGTVTGTDDFFVNVTSGRFVNTATYDLPGPVVVTGDGTQAIIATAGGSFTVASLTLDSLSRVGFDDGVTGTATMTCTPTSILTCVVNHSNTFRPISRFRSGAESEFGADYDNSVLSTSVALDGTLIVDLENYTGGANTLTLIDVDTLTGAFTDTQVINVPDGLTASVAQNATTVTLTVS